MNNKIKKFFVKFQEDEILTRSAALAYYSSLSIAPLIILMMIILGALDFDLQVELVTTVNSMIGKEAGHTLTTAIQAASARSLTLSVSGIISFLILSISASIIFKELQSTLNKIFDIELSEEDKKKTFFDSVKLIITDRALAVFMVFMSIVIILISIVASALVNYFRGKIDVWYFGYSQLLISFLSLNLLFTFMLRVLPQRIISYKKAFYGGLIITILFMVGKGLIGHYLGEAAIGSAYGAAGSLVALLVWFYYSSLTLFLGAEIVHFFVIDRDSSKNFNEELEL